MAIRNNAPTDFAEQESVEYHKQLTDPTADRKNITVPAAEPTRQRNDKPTSGDAAKKAAIGRARAGTRAADKAKANVSKGTKAEQILKKLRAARGASLETLMEVTGWQAHSVRGFLSATVRKKLGLELLNETAKDGTRRYRIEQGVKGE